MRVVGPARIASRYPCSRATLASITKEGRKVARAATKRLNADRFGTTPLDPSACDDLVELLTPLRSGAGDFES